MERVSAWPSAAGAERELVNEREAVGMDRRELFLARLAELAREYEEPLRGWELVRSRLAWEDWEGLRVEAVACAKEEIRRRKWRGVHGGVLPNGCEAEDVADQAIAEMLEGRCRLALGFTRERVVAELKRLVKRRVRVLHGLRETGAMRNEWDVVPVKEEKEPVSVFQGMADERGEAAKVWEEYKREFEDFLGQETELLGVFGCLWTGVTRPVEVAQRLGITEEAVGRARKKLARRVAAFAKRREACERHE